MTQQIRLRINGVERSAQVADDLLLVDFLRDHLGLTGAKVGCGHGVCGTCTVIFNGQATKSCIMLAAQADEAEIRTVEGIEAGDGLSPVQKAFIEQGGFQCGYCTSGMITAATALLEKNPSPTEEEIRTGLAGNLCRCTGYTRIVQAVQKAADALKSGQTG
jgi:carbon-monoxide dehydrogenase small subunit